MPRVSRPRLVQRPPVVSRKGGVPISVDVARLGRACSEGPVVGDGLSYGGEVQVVGQVESSIIIVPLVVAGLSPGGAEGVLSGVLQVRIADPYEQGVGVIAHVELVVHRCGGAAVIIVEAEFPQVVGERRMQGEKTAAFLLFRSVPAVEQPVALGDGLQREVKLSPFPGFQVAVELRRMYPRPPWCVVAVRSVENLLERVAGGGQSSEVRPRGSIPAVVVVEAVDCTVVGGVRLFVGVFQVPVELTVVGSHCAGVDG